MCWENHTQHSGCGHYGEISEAPYTLCASAHQRVLKHRGPTSPPLSPIASFNPQPLKRSSTSATFANRFFSAPLTRNNTTSSFAFRRTISGPPDPNNSHISSSPFAPSTAELDVTPGVNVTDYEIKNILCAKRVKRTRVVSGGAMKICNVCKRSVDDMRFMIERFDQTGSVKGTKAFEEFLEGKGDKTGGDKKGGGEKESVV